MKAGRLGQGEEDAQKILLFGGRKPAGWVVLGQTLLEAGKLEEAERALMEAGRLAPGNKEVQQALHELLRMKTARKRRNMAPK